MNAPAARTAFGSAAVGINRPPRTLLAMSVSNVAELAARPSSRDADDQPQNGELHRSDHDDGCHPEQLQRVSTHAMDRATPTTVAAPERMTRLP